MTRTIIAAAVLAIAGSAFAQTATTSAAPATATTITVNDSHQVREQLMSLLRNYPPQVGAVLKLDPTLFNNSSYLGTYPALAEFIAQHPDVAHNPQFFFAYVSTPDDQNRIDMGAIGGFVAFLVVTAVVVWIVKTLVEQRRWSRAMQTQNEVHSKMLDRLTSNAELLSYIQTPSGQRFLDSASIRLEGAPRPMSAPIGRIFWSLQAGLVAIGLAVGLVAASEMAQARGQAGQASLLLYGFGVSSLAIGLALVLSAIVFYFLSRHFGHFAKPAEGPAE